MLQVLLEEKQDQVTNSSGSVEMRCSTTLCDVAKKNRNDQTNMLSN